MRGMYNVGGVLLGWNDQKSYQFCRIENIYPKLHLEHIVMRAREVGATKLQTHVYAC
jgi:hypothetical protein